MRLAAQLCSYDLSRLKTREEKLAFWINLYNAMVLHVAVELGVKNGLRGMDGFIYRIDGYNYSLDDMEHGMLRGNARPPRRLGSALKKPGTPVWATA